MYGNIKEHLAMELEKINDAGLFKAERIISSSQQAEIELESGEKVLNFCANNYLGLSNHPELVQAAKNALDTHGFGMSSVRFICGTQDLHKTLEQLFRKHVRYKFLCRLRASVKSFPMYTALPCSEYYEPV